jgi:DNA-binding phage protein
MATRPKVEELDDKHWHALELIEAGETNMSEVARQIGMEPTDFHRLVQGNVEKMGNVASIFNREYAKIVDKKISGSEKNITRLLNECQEVSLRVISREIKKYEEKKRLTEDDQKMLTYLTKAMATLKPSSPKSVKLSQTWNYTKGLTPQELEHEFGRLKGLSEGPPDT